MLIYVLLFILGLILLIKGGDWFVDASTSIAHRFNVSELLIGATVVSIGTTLPEVMVSATSALQGHGEIAYGNAIGSIICNTALISAISIVANPSNVNVKSLKIPVIFFFTAAAIYAVTAYSTGYFSRLTGIILLAVFVAYVIYSIISAKKVPSTVSDTSTNNNSRNLISDVALLIIGAAMIAFGADLLVDNGIEIAKILGVPESVIALTFVALGTSLPELVTAVTSLVKGHGLLSLGNIIGANIFNLVLVSGVASTLSPFSIPANKTIAGMNASLVLDIPLMIGVMALLCVPALISGKLKRGQGIILLLIYASFCVIQFVL